MAGLKLGGGSAATSNMAAAKKEFVERTGATKVLVAPRRARVTKGSDVGQMFLSLMLFGSWGSGKTYGISELLKLGLKICVINTDIGANGILSVRMALRQQQREELLQNLYIVDLYNDVDVQAFLVEPKAFFPEIYEVGIDVLVWDGFSWWQQNDLFEAVGRGVEEEASSALAGGGKLRVVSDARAAGNKFEQQDWQVIRNASLKTLKKFCGLHNKVTGQLWHKIVTCQESVKSVKKGNDMSVLTETKSPFVSGAAGNFMGGAFDLIIRTVSKTATDGDEGERRYEYVIQGNQTNMTKVRGFKLPAVMDADMGALWEMLEEQAGIKRGATLEEAKGEVCLANESEDE